MRAQDELVAACLACRSVRRPGRVRPPRRRRQEGLPEYRPGLVIVGQALSGVVGPLIEVPVLVGLVRVSLARRREFLAAPQSAPTSREG
jgi:hypothetical protein